MKIIVSVVALALLTVNPVSANEPSATLEQTLGASQTRKLAEVARFIDLEGDTKASFDALYAEFQEALGALNEKYANLSYRLLERSAVPTVEATKQIIHEFNALEKKRLDIKESYFVEFGKILDATKLIRLFQFENKADAIARHELATQIPILE